MQAMDLAFNITVSVAQGNGGKKASMPITDTSDSTYTFGLWMRLEIVYLTWLAVVDHGA